MTRFYSFSTWKSWTFFRRNSRFMETQREVWSLHRLAWGAEDQSAVRLWPSRFCLQHLSLITCCHCLPDTAGILSCSNNEQGIQKILLLPFKAINGPVPPFLWAMEKHLHFLLLSFIHLPLSTCLPLVFASPPWGSLTSETERLSLFSHLHSTLKPAFNHRQNNTDSF